MREAMKNVSSVLYEGSPITNHDVYLFRQGNHFRLYEKFGAHTGTRDGVRGTFFAVWAPNAARVSVTGDFNGWKPGSHPLKVREDESGIWEGFVPGVERGTCYKYHVVSNHNGYTVDKADPFAFFSEVPPRTASRVWDLQYRWEDDEWMKGRGARAALDAPIAIYEVHLGSWRRGLEGRRDPLSYRDAARQLAEYAREMGFTHVELMPVMEHPFYGSWGYQITGYFAATSRYGEPEDLMFLIDTLHRHGIGVILDWVPSHFPSDGHGLVYFDGTHLFEHQDPRKGIHPEWQSYLFNYGRHEVRSFLISNALFWLDRYHADGLRIDAVASMLYLDYGRSEGEWIPNAYGGRENLEAIDFIKRLSEASYKFYPDTQLIAEESTAWPMVTRPTYVGGLGFGLKWNMGWMHDTLEYFSKDPIYRKHHQNQLTFSIWYAFFENFLLPLSHDEVVHGKGSLLRRMPGDDWQRFANLRLLFGYMYAHPGKKLLFMGGEIGQSNEWYHETSLDWHLLQYPVHKGVQQWVRDLNRLYASEPPLYRKDCEAEGFEWIDFQDAAGSIVSFLRKGDPQGAVIAAVFNFTPVPRRGYSVGVPYGGPWKEVLNSDGEAYGGTGVGNKGQAVARQVPCQGRPFSLLIDLPPLGALFFKGISRGTS
jgi:1,4-alpha-glucan branching enzyme